MTEAKISGNQDAQQTSATDAHNEAVVDWLGFPARVIIGGISTILALCMVIGFPWFSFFFRLMLAGGLIWGGSKLATLKKANDDKAELFWLWPGILRTTGFIYLALAIISSGFYTWTRDKINHIEGAVTCSVDSTLPSCQVKQAAAAADLAKKQAEELAAAQHAAALKAQQRIAEERAREQALVDADTYDCVDQRYSPLRECKKVVFGPMTKYDREALPGYCLTASQAVARKSLGGNQWRFTAPNGAVVHFYDQRVGETILGVTCGE